ncbi:hypothetical protein NDU88_005669 [Pleurodeles waltl]|uniref:Uncharacterized protein n=1 Tax=Pleurodeles waltl TaxID=8319 RepID=A0AAV7QJQ4_PLEWA|nr:hypothetical protein NDU88_005669 [Pleurodeles waltl]
MMRIRGHYSGDGTKMLCNPGDLIGHLWQPRDQLRVKSGASERSREGEARRSGDIRATKEEQEDEETTIEEEDGRKTEPTGAGVSQRRFGDSWPGEPAYTPPRFRRSVASPGAGFSHCGSTPRPGQEMATEMEALPRASLNEAAVTGEG